MLSLFAITLQAASDTPPWRHALMGALTGWAVAAKTDYAAFVGWKSIQDALAYDWKVALWRWFQGAVIGAVSVTGFGQLLG